MKVNKTKYSVFLFIIAVCYTVYYVSNNASPNLDDVQVLGMFAITQFVFSIYSWYKLRGTILDAYIIFIVAFYAFNVGQPMLQAFGLMGDFRNLWNDWLTNFQYFDASFYSMLCLFTFHLGALQSLNKKIDPIEDTEVVSLNIQKIGQISGIIALISAPLYIRSLINDYITIQIYGYIGLYEVQSSSRVLDLIGDFFVPSIIVYAYKNLYFKNKVILTTALMVGTIFLPPLILGGRSNAMIILAIILILYSSIRDISKKQWVLIASIVVGSLLLMNIVGKVRSGTNRSMKAYTQASKDNDGENPLVSTLSEMGWSMYPMGLTTTAVPAFRPYDYGASFFWSLFSVVPNIGFWSEHPSNVHDPSAWLNNYSGVGYGIGYSLIAESYNDFGYCGAIAMFLFGVLFASIFKNVSRQYAFNTPLKFILSILFLWFSIKCVRNSCYGLVRGCVYYILPLFIIFKLYTARQHK